MTAPTTLQEAAAERERLRAALEAAEQRVAELEPLWHAAHAAVSKAREDLARLDLAVGSAKRAHLITQAVAELGIPTEEPPVIVVPNPHGLPGVFELVALSEDGRVGLYRRNQERRGRMPRTEAIRVQHVPPRIPAILDELKQAQDAYSEAGREHGYRGDEYEAAKRAHKTRTEALRAELRELVGGTADGVSRFRDVDLFGWQGRGKGDFGAGSGAMKPLAPPSGRRWRWLKVREQAELEGGE